jgi:hypothetical protein
MFPVMFSLWYEERDQIVNDTATNLLWISHGYAPSLELLGVLDETLDMKEFEDVKHSMLKIAYPSMYANK